MHMAIAHPNVRHTASGGNVEPASLQMFLDALFRTGMTTSQRLKSVGCHGCKTGNLIWSHPPFQMGDVIPMCSSLRYFQ